MSIANLAVQKQAAQRENSEHNKLARQYQPFATGDVLDENVGLHIANNPELPGAAREVLFYISRKSFGHKTFGVIYEKPKNIAEKLACSESKVRTALRDLKKAGIISRITYIRPGLKGNGASLTVILPFAAAEPGEVYTPDCRPEFADRSDTETPTATRDEDTFSAGESFSFKSFKKKREEDIYKQRAGARDLSLFEIELKEQGIERGFSQDLLDRFITELNRQDLYTYRVRDIETAFVDYDRVMRKIANGERDHVYNPASYFVTLLRTAIINNEQLDRVREQEQAAEEARLQEQAALVAEFGEFTFYNWLEDEESNTYQEQAAPQTEPDRPVYITYHNDSATLYDLEELNAEFEQSRKTYDDIFAAARKLQAEYEAEFGE